MRVAKIDLRFAGEKGRKYLRAPIRHVKEIDAGDRLEHFAGHVGQSEQNDRNQDHGDEEQHP
jgi:hypothetical protein